MSEYALGAIRLSTTEPPTANPSDGSISGGDTDPPPVDPPVTKAMYPILKPNGTFIPDDQTEWESAFGTASDSDVYIPLPTALFNMKPVDNWHIDEQINPGIWQRYLITMGIVPEPKHAVGLFEKFSPSGAGGVDLHPKRGVEFFGTISDWYSPQTPATYDVGTDDSIAFMVIFRAVPTDADSQIILTKRVAPHSSVGIDSSAWTGYEFRIDTDGHGLFECCDGTNKLQVKTDAPVNDCAWHCALCVLNRKSTNGEVSIHLHSDVGTATADSGDTGTNLGDLTCSNAMCIGCQKETNEGFLSFIGEVAYTAFWEQSGPFPAPGSGEGDFFFGGEILDRFWDAERFALNEYEGGGVLKSYKEGVAAWPLGEDSYGALVCHYHGGTGNNTPRHAGQLPYTLMGDSSATEGGFGSKSENAQNLLLYSDDLNLDRAINAPVQARSIWEIGGGCIYIDNGVRLKGIAPNGLEIANMLDIREVGERVPIYIGQKFDDPSTGTVTASVWLRLTGMVGTPYGTVEIGDYEGNNATVINLTDIQTELDAKFASSKWVRVSTTYEGTANNKGIRVAAKMTDSNGGPITSILNMDMWGAQLEFSDHAGPYLATTSSGVYSTTGDALYEDFDDETWEFSENGGFKFDAKFPYGSSKGTNSALITLNGTATVDGVPDQELRLTAGRFMDSGVAKINWNIEHFTGSTWTSLVTGLSNGVLSQPLLEGERNEWNPQYVKVYVEWDFQNTTISLKADEYTDPNWEGISTEGTLTKTVENFVGTGFLIGGQAQSQGNYTVQEQSNAQLSNIEVLL